MKFEFSCHWLTLVVFLGLYSLDDMPRRERIPAFFSRLMRHMRHIFSFDFIVQHGCSKLCSLVKQYLKNLLCSDTKKNVALLLALANVASLHLSIEFVLFFL